MRALLCGDIHPNPGPDDARQYQILPIWLHLMRARFGVPPFARDLFADALRAHAPAFWTSGDSAFAHPWRTLPGWNLINPPWDMLPQVVSRLLVDACSAIIVAPLWPTAWLRTLLRSCHAFWVLPPARVYRSLPGAPPPTVPFLADGPFCVVPGVFVAS